MGFILGVWFGKKERGNLSLYIIIYVIYIRRKENLLFSTSSPLTQHNFLHRILYMSTVTTTLTLLLPAEMLQQVDDLRFSMRLKSRQETIRFAIQQFIDKYSVGGRPQTAIERAVQEALEEGREQNRREREGKD